MDLRVMLTAPSFLHPVCDKTEGRSLRSTARLVPATLPPIESCLNVSSRARLRRIEGACNRGWPGQLEGAAPSAQRTPSEPLVVVDELRTHFETRSGVVRAVDGVSLSVAQGQTLGIVGESGCGKTVTALSIIGLLPSPPARIVGGSIHFEGRDLTT
ncbi:MAG TPA: ATP-binding cassette domain-containing protein, partial [Gaiellaceae bacterium]